jgi:hypothetical protein
LGNGYEVFLLVSLLDKMPRQRMLHAEVAIFLLSSVFPIFPIALNKGEFEENPSADFVPRFLPRMT